jgi:pimeloyl-ACP methyl ester carboxylesterase
LALQRDNLWYKDAVIYQLHVRSFYDSNADGVGDFPGLTQKLDYLQELGITAIWLLPFYPSPLRDDGYDIADYTSVNPAYGSLEDFKAFLDAANTLSDDLSAVMQQLDLQGVTLVTHSMGCGELVRYFSLHGGRGIARIVMVAPITPGALKTPDNPDGVDTAALEKAREALCTDRPHVIAAAAPAFFGAPKNPVSAEMMQWWTDMLLQCTMKVLLQLHRVFTTTDFRPDLRTISLPTLIIQGDCDTSTPLELSGRKTAALIPGSQLKVYESAAHGLPVTHAERLITICWSSPPVELAIHWGRRRRIRPPHSVQLIRRGHEL